eukprot:135833_1
MGNWFSSNAIKLYISYNGIANLALGINTTYHRYPSNNQWDCGVAGPSDTCIFHCDAIELAVTQSFFCGNASDCQFECDAEKCADHTILYGEGASTLNINVLSGGIKCMQKATVYAPDSGSLYLNRMGDEKAFTDMTIHASDTGNTQDIIIDCTHGLSNGEECKKMQIHAQKARYLEILVSSSGSMFRGHYDANKDTTTYAKVYCPVNSDYNGPEVAPCVFDMSGGGSMDKTYIYTTNGIPRDVWIKEATSTTITDTILYCDAGSTTSDIWPKTSVCWQTHAPTTDPTEIPTGAPSNAPTLTPTMHPTKYPTSAPTFSPSNAPTSSPTDPTASPSNTPTMSPSATPTHAPTVKPSLFPTRLREGEVVEVTRKVTAMTTDSSVDSSVSDNGFEGTNDHETPSVLTAVLVSVIGVLCSVLIVIALLYRRMDKDRKPAGANARHRDRVRTQSRVQYIQKDEDEEEAEHKARNVSIIELNSKQHSLPYTGSQHVDNNDDEKEIEEEHYNDFNPQWDRVRNESQYVENNDDEKEIDGVVKKAKKGTMYSEGPGTGEHGGAFDVKKGTMYSEGPDEENGGMFYVKPQVQSGLESIRDDELVRNDSVVTTAGADDEMVKNEKCELVPIQEWFARDDRVKKGTMYSEGPNLEDTEDEEILEWIKETEIQTDADKKEDRDNVDAAEHADKEEEIQTETEIPEWVKDTVTTGGADDMAVQQVINKEKNCELVKEWLIAQVELPQYYDILVDNGYDSVNIIKEITDEKELEAIGIVMKGHLLKLIKEIERLREFLDCKK